MSGGDEQGPIEPELGGGDTAPASSEPAPPAPPTHVDLVVGEASAVGESAALPGEHRGGFQRQMTAPVTIAQTESGPSDDLTMTADVHWAPTPAPLPRHAPWALVFAILGLIVSLLVGWGFLIGIVGAVLSIVALRRPWEARGVAVWALCLSVLSLIYSGGWLWWASTQGPLFS